METCCIKKIIIKVIYILASLSFLMAYHHIYSTTKHIQDFNLIRDEKPILDIFKKNWRDLVAYDFSPEKMLRERKLDMQYIGPLHIKVMRKKNKLVGFIIYYMENNEKGIISALAIDQDFRGKGYGKELMQYAMQKLLLNGAKTIGIWVLIDNVPAKKLYEKLGFVEKIFDGKENWYLEFSV